MSDAQGTAKVKIEPDLSDFTASAVAIGNLVSNAIETGLSKAGALLKDLGGIGQNLLDAYNTVQVQTGATGNDLIKFEGIINQVGSQSSQKLTDIAGAVGVIHDRFRDLNDNQLKTVTNSFQQLATITGTNLKMDVDNLGGALVLFNTPAAEMGKRMNEVYAATQVAGVSLYDMLPTLNSVGASAQGLGYSFEGALGIVASFAKIGLDATNIQLAMGKAAKLAGDAGISSSEEWKKLFDQWKSAPNAQAAFTDAAGEIGTRAARLAVEVQDGSLNFDQLTKSIQGSTASIQDSFDKTDTLTRQWAIFKNAIQVDLSGPATGLNLALVNVLKTLQDSLGPALQRLGDAVGPSITKIVETLGPEFGDFINSISPILSSLFFLITTVFTDSQPVIEAFMGLLKELAPVFNTVINQISAVLGPALKSLAPIVEGLGKVLTPVISSLGIAFVAIIKALAPALIAVADAMGPIAFQLGQQFSLFIVQLVPLLPGLVTSIGQLAVALVEVVGSGILPFILDLLPPFTYFLIDMTELASSILQVKPLLEALVITVGLLFLAFKGASIINDAMLAFKRYQQVTEVTQSKLAGFFSSSQDEAQTNAIVMQQTFEKIGASLETLIGQFEQLTIVIEQMQNQMLEANYGGVTPLDIAFEDFGVTLAPLPAEIDAVGVSLDGLSAAEDEAAGAATGLSAALDANPIGIIALAVVALGTVLYELYQHVQPIHDAFDAFGRIIKSTVGAVVDWLKEGDHLKDTLEGIGIVILGPIGALIALYDHFQPFKTLINDIVGLFKDLFTGQFGKLGEDLGKIGDAFANLWDTIWTKVLPKLGDFLSKIGDWITGTAAPWLGEHFAQWGTAALSWIGKTLEALPGQLFNIMVTIGTWIDFTAIPWLWDKFKTIVPAVLGWIGQAALAMPGEFLKLIAEIASFIITAGIWLTIHGGELVAHALEWIGTAVQQMPGKLWNMLYAFADWVITSAAPWIGAQGEKLLKAVTQWIIDAAKATPGLLENWAKTFIDFFASLPTRMANAAKGLFDFIPTAFKDAVNFMVGLYDDWADHFIIGGKWGIPKIQPFPHIDKPFKAADGAILNSATQIIAGEAGPEVVIPLSKPNTARNLANASGLTNILGDNAGGGGATTQIFVTLNPPSGMSHEQAQNIGETIGAAIASRIPSAVKMG